MAKKRVSHFGGKTTIQTGSKSGNKWDVYSSTKGSKKHDHIWKDKKGKIGMKLRSSGKYEGRGCFLTTACVMHAGLTDDCYELQQLRTFRDSYVINLLMGKKILEKYYEEAPKIVEKILNSKEKELILSNIYKIIQRAIYFIKLGNNKKAFDCYQSMFQKLSTKFNKDN